MPFAVVDFETTGIHPAYNHRVVEIGITHVDDAGTVTGRWETLVNPQRDLGPQRIHGVRAAEVLDAPVFADIAADFAELLQGRVFAAHNASFDLRFLEAEFERAGYWLDGGTPTVCTMQLGSNFGLGASASLVRACGSFGIEQGHAHTAGDDSHAAAQLLGAYRRSSATWPGWDDYWEQTLKAGRGYAFPSGQTTGVAWQSRADLPDVPPSFLERISVEVERDTAVGAAADYLALLDRCLIDGDISLSEGAQLAGIAAELGLDRVVAEALHADYYRELVRQAWADGIVTDDERAELAAVATMLKLPAEIRDASAAPVSSDDDECAAPNLDRFALRAGDMVVLTGEMSRERSDWEAELRTRGFAPHPNITKKVALVVAADPDSLSGKAKKAREYGIPIVNEAGLARLLERGESS